MSTNIILTNTSDDFPDYVIAIFFFTPIILGLLLLIRNKRFDKKWKVGIFPKKYKFNQDHLLEAYLSLAALIMQIQKRKKREKIIFINSYFNKYFKKSNYNFSDSLIYSFKHPIRPETVTNWLKIHIKNKIERIHIIYFLVGITMINGKISIQEKKILALINIQLELNLNDLERIIAMYASYQEYKMKKLNPQITNNKLIRASKILGITMESNLGEIKNAYRKMVKLHHPDKFQNLGPEQIKIAKEKFIQIQHSYKLMKRKTEYI